MAKRVAIPFKEVKPVVVGPLGAYEASRIQRFDIPVTLPTTDVDELGHRYHAGTVTDLPQVTVTINGMDVSAKLFAALTGTDYATYPAPGVDINELGYLDVIGAIKDETLEDVVKTVHVRQARVTGFTFSYSVDGDATEEYTAQSSDKRWFKNDVVVDTDDTAGTGPFALSQTPIQLKNGNYLVSVIADGAYLTEVVGVPAAGEYSYSAGNVTLGTAIANQVVMVYHAVVAGNNWTDVSDTTVPASLRGKNIPVKINSNTTQRVQSVTIRGTLPVTAIKEMGNLDIAGYVTQVPTVEGDLSVLDSDTELVSLFATGALNPADTEFRVCEFTASGISLEVILYDPSLACNLPLASGTVLKTVYIPEIVITSEGHSTSVGGNATQTFGFKSKDGSCLVFKGAKP
jgi:hypothetical protein